MRCLIALLLLAACKSEDPGEDAGTGDDAGVLGEAIRTNETSGNTGTAGELAVTVSVEEGDRSFMVVGTSEEAHLAVLAIDDPSGATILRWQDWYNERRYVTNAFWATRQATVINWPIRDIDPALVPGDYVVHLGSYRADGTTSRPDIDVDVTSLISSDQDVERGAIRVLVLWADGLGEDAALVSATEAAIAHWADVWEGADMALEVRYEQSSIDPLLPYPGGMGGPVLLEASAFAEPGEVVVIIGELVNDDPSQYGVSGQLPGPLVPSTLSAIVVGWLANAGGDGVFSDNDIQLYGEVLAHEVGHYAGLFHPVESAYDAWDALDDTPECGGQRACEDMLGTNLMFPYSIGCATGMCLSTTGITNDQRAVMQRYTGTR
jgi:hypothetical protein